MAPKNKYQTDQQANINRKALHETIDRKADKEWKFEYGFIVGLFVGIICGAAAMFLILYFE